MGAVVPGNTDKRSDVGETVTVKFRLVPTISVYTCDLMVVVLPTVADAMTMI